MRLPLSSRRSLPVRPCVALDCCCDDGTTASHVLRRWLLLGWRRVSAERRCSTGCLCGKQISHLVHARNAA